MLKVDLGLTRVSATREGVLALHESINMPLVSIPNIGTAPTQAFVLGVRQEAGSYAVMVVLRQSDNDANLVYVSDPRNLNAEQYRFEEAEGLRFVESMGFLMNDHGYRALAPERQTELLERTPIFVGAKVERTVDLVELEEESVVPDAFEPDAIFGGLENVPMLKGQPESPPSFAPSSRAAAATQRPTAPAPAPGLTPRSSIPSIGSGSSNRPGAAGAGFGGLTGGLGTGGFGGPLGQAGLGAGSPLGSVGLATAGAAGPGPASPVPSAAGPGFGANAGGGLGAITNPAAGLGLGSPTPAFGAQRPAGPVAPAATVNAESLARLGRFLSTFVVLFALGVGTLRCVHSTSSPGPAEPLDHVTQNKLDIAEHFLSQAMWAEAVSAFQPVIEAAPNDASVRHGLAIALMYLDRAELAEQSFRKSIALDPGYSTAKNSLATLFLQQNRCEEAAVLLREVLEDILYPTPEFAQDNLARAEHCVGKTAEALKRLEKLVIAKPQFCRAYLTMADIATAARSPEATIRACDDFMNRCEMHEQIGKLVSPENRALCYLRKGMAQAALGDVDAARRSLERCDSPGAFGRQCKQSLELLSGGSWEHGRDE